MKVGLTIPILHDAFHAVTMKFSDMSKADASAVFKSKKEIKRQEIRNRL